jgi:hypothetical protein
MDNLKTNIEQIKKDLLTDNFIAENNLGWIKGDNQILADDYYDGEALSFATKILDLLYLRMTSPVPNELANNGETKHGQ